MAHSGRLSFDAVSVVRRPLSQLLGGRALDLTFYAAMRRLEVVFRQAPRFGESLHPSSEPVRFGQDPSLAFRGSALTAVHDGDETRPPQLRVSFFGAHGPHGPLPTHLTQYIEERRLRRRDSTWIGFLDIFHHRLISLFYRAWANPQPTVHRDRPDTDRYARHLGSIIGLNPSADARAPSELDELALYAATHFIGPKRNAEGLGKVLRLCFGVPIAVEEFIGQWLDIPVDYCWRLPPSIPHVQSAVGVLGESTRIGTQTWDRQSKFRVVVGPVALADYRRFLPGGDHLTRLIELVQRYAGLEAQWDARLILREADRGGAILGVVGVLGQTSNLGQGDGGAASFENFSIDPQEVSHA